MITQDHTAFMYVQHDDPYNYAYDQGQLRAPGAQWDVPPQQNREQSFGFQQGTHYPQQFQQEEPDPQDSYFDPQLVLMMVGLMYLVMNKSFIHKFNKIKVRILHKIRPSR